MNKNRYIIGELQEFFAKNDSSKAINSISTIMNSIRIQSKVIGSVKNPNCKFTCLQVLQLLVLFPFFSIKNATNYSSSALGKMFVCHKDMFYRFMNDGNINWRRIIYSVFRQVYSRVKRRTTLKSDIRCVIIDDTDLPKTGFKTEKIGKVFSHTQMKPILGFKAMFLCFTDGVSQFLLDFSLLMERKENEAISHRVYPRNRRKLATARNTQRISVLPGVALSILQVRLRRPSVCSNAQS